MNPTERPAARRIRPLALVAPFALALALSVSVLACGGDDTPAEPEAAPATPDAPAAQAKPPKKNKKKQTAALAAPAPDVPGLEATIGEGARIPEGFPEDVPLYPGARPTATMSAAGEGTLVTFDIEDSPEKVYDFYQEKLAGGGWEIASSASMGGQWMIRALKDQRSASISIAGAGTGSQVGVAVAKAE